MCDIRLFVKNLQQKAHRTEAVIAGEHGRLTLSSPLCKRSLKYYKSQPQPYPLQSLSHDSIR